MVKGIVVGVEVPFGHDTEGPDSGQRAAVLAVQLVSAVAIDDQFALLAARQVDVVHRAVAGIVIIPVALVVHRAGAHRRHRALRTPGDQSIERQTSLPPCAGCAVWVCP